VCNFYFPIFSFELFGRVGLSVVSIVFSFKCCALTATVYDACRHHGTSYVNLHPSSRML